MVGTDPPTYSGRNRRTVLAGEMGAPFDVAEDVDLLDAVFARPVDPLGRLTDRRMGRPRRFGTWSADGRATVDEDHRNVTVGGLYGLLRVCGLLLHRTSLPRRIARPTPYPKIVTSAAISLFEIRPRTCAT